VREQAIKKPMRDGILDDLIKLKMLLKKNFDLIQMN